jgi:hypothetical protein
MPDLLSASLFKSAGNAALSEHEAGSEGQGAARCQPEPGRCPSDKTERHAREHVPASAGASSTCGCRVGGGDGKTVRSYLRRPSVPSGWSFWSCFERCSNLPTLSHRVLCRSRWVSQSGQHNAPQPVGRACSRRHLLHQHVGGLDANPNDPRAPPSVLFVVRRRRVAQPVHISDDGCPRRSVDFFPAEFPPSTKTGSNVGRDRFES